MSASTPDFVVVGAGAAGGVVAKELATAGFRVVVLEQGPWLRERDFRHDELWALRQHALTNDHRRQPNTRRESEAATATLRPTITYGRMVGGGSVHFTANYWRFHEIDFVERSRKGPVTGTGLDDWPISYAELEPYYAKAEWELGVSGQAGPADPPRSRPYPLPPLPPSRPVCWPSGRPSGSAGPRLRPRWPFCHSPTRAGQRASSAGTARTSAARCRRRAARS